MMPKVVQLHQQKFYNSGPRTQPNKNLFWVIYIDIVASPSEKCKRQILILNQIQQKSFL